MSTNPTHIVFIIPSKFFFGGAERRYSLLASYLSCIYPGLSVSVITSSSTLKKLRNSSLLSPDVRTIAYLDKGWRRVNILSYVTDTAFYYVWIILQALRARPDFVFIVSNPDIFLLLFTLVSYLMPKWAFSMNATLFETTSKSISRYIAAPMSVIAARSVDCLSPQCLNILKSYLFYGAHKLYVAPCSFIDTSQVKPYRPMADRHIDVLMMTRFVDNKGLDLIHSIKHYLKGLNVCICGEGDYEVDNNLFNVFYTSDPYSVLSNSKIFLSLQCVNNYPSQSLLAAMHSGCAIIATDVGETRMLLNESNSILIDYNPSELLDAISCLLQSPSLMEDLASKSRYDAMSLHRISRYSDYFLESIVGFS